MSVWVHFHARVADPGPDVDITYEMGGVPRVGEGVELDGTSFVVEAVDWVVDPDMYERGFNGRAEVLLR